MKSKIILIVFSFLSICPHTQAMDENIGFVAKFLGLAGLTGVCYWGTTRACSLCVKKCNGLIGYEAIHEERQIDLELQFLPVQNLALPQAESSSDISTVAIKENSNKNSISNESEDEA